MEDALSSALAPAAYPPKRNPMPKARKTQCACVLIACRRCHLKPACEEPPPTSALHFRATRRQPTVAFPRSKLLNANRAQDAPKKETPAAGQRPLRRETALPTTTLSRNAIAAACPNAPDRLRTPENPRSPRRRRGKNRNGHAPQAPRKTLWRTEPNARRGTSSGHARARKRARLRPH